MERTITASRAEVARRRRRRQKRNTTIFVTALIVLVILTVTVIVCVAAFGGRDLGSETVPKNPAGVNPGEPQGDDAVLPAGDGTDEGENSGDGEADDGTGTEPQESDSDKISRLVAEADRLAASYDYDGAIELIKTYGADYAQKQALTDAIAGYESTKSTMVRYSDVTTIPHIFFHSLIADTSRAFDGDYDQDGYNLYMTTVYEFEHMMIELMTRMGYKGADGEAFVTQKSNDGGIDGILNQDALGLRKIYVQVKRYAEDNTVGRQTISQFHGDLDLQGAGSGVFITTSSFTRSAEEAGKKFNIRLIDGEALTKLMIEYKVGVQVQSTYELLEIDNDFFDKSDN